MLGRVVNIEFACQPMRLSRLNEYTPPTNPWWPGSGDQYVAFLIDTLKPLIDRDFRTSAARAHTGIFGSSLGALISLYAFFTRADVFGFVGAMSPSLWVGRSLIAKGWKLIAGVPSIISEQS